MKILLDTNVLIDYVARRKPFAADALKLRIAQAFGDIEWWASPHSYLDMLYILRHAAAPETLRSALLASLEFTHICSLSQEELAAALAADWPDAEDCVVALCAENIDADYLVTRNPAHFKKSSIKCVTPQELLGVLTNDYGLCYEEISLDLAPVPEAD